MKISDTHGHFQDWLTQMWVKLTGRGISSEKESWLIGPIGGTDVIKDHFVRDLAEKEGLHVLSNKEDVGLLESFSDLGLSKEEMVRVKRQVVDFYERTSNYNFEFWSEWRGFFRPFGWLLSVIFSKRLQQLNLPLSSLDSSKGIESNIIKLVDPITGLSKWTIWYRILKSTNRVIYSGVYSTCVIPNTTGRFLKVVFPLPNGNASVIMRAAILSDGSLMLTSDGKRFGDNGFYFTLTNRNGKYWARHVRAMHEWIRVYTDDDHMLRADHNLYIWGLPFLKLHYKMTNKA